MSCWIQGVLDLYPCALQSQRQSRRESIQNRVPRRTRLVPSGDCLFIQTSSIIRWRLKNHPHLDWHSINDWLRHSHRIDCSLPMSIQVVRGNKVDGGNRELTSLFSLLPYVQFLAATEFFSIWQNGQIRMLATSGELLSDSA